MLHIKFPLTMTKELDSAGYTVGDAFVLPSSHLTYQVCVYSYNCMSSVK